MTIIASPPISGGRGPIPDGAGDPRTGSRMWTSRLIGALFLAGFLFYGTGTVLVNSVVDGSDFLAGVGAHETTLALGAFLMIATAAIDIGKAVLFFPVLERHGKRTAVAYLATMVFEMALMTVGVLALLMIIPLAGQSDQLGPDAAQALGSLAVDTNETAYQIGQLSLAFGCLFMCALLLRTGLIPKWLAGLGLVGYALHLLGASTELFGVPLSLVLLVPGAIFEVTLAIWLLVKGFTPAVFDDAGTTKAGA
ncbi:DUF4386 domain-containing protein [Nocardioides halotolerans]|uniref:DUF4386 domain-containing protein n=1 Tax=Nocardioides halotolerans TaxID=433660 RepID=UPI0009FCED50|nr:DUF4386 domain-containing protein [Nocardioides halotolerans]